MSMVNEKQPFALRCSVLYCVQSFLYKNTAGQQMIVQSLLPSQEAVDVSTGQLLCGGLFSNDPVSNWLCAVAMSQAMELKKKNIYIDEKTLPLLLLNNYHSLEQY